MKQFRRNADRPIAVHVSVDFMMEFWYLSTVSCKVLIKQFYKYRQIECLKRVLF